MASISTLPRLTDAAFSIDEYLAQERAKDLLRFSTAGSVDDGKSTLIGRLLYDTQSVYQDQIRSIEGKGTTAPGQIDFALLTDGLRAEREQGITIDVAYRYFSTARRKFIIADTPGHEQYTRNMATGASTADAAVVLIDARKGVLSQSRRHAYIASLLGVRHIVVAVNKMDLVNYEESVFHAIRDTFAEVLRNISADTGTRAESVFVPVSALVGDNVVHRSAAMRWYRGPALLELLEELPPSSNSKETWNAPFRLAVQRVVRPDHTFRGFSGQIASGTVRPGDRITVLPSGREAQVTRIVTYNGDLAEAVAPLSVTLVLARELDISRGDLIVSTESPAKINSRFKAALVWMDERPLECNRRYLLKHASQTVPATVSSLEYRAEIESLLHHSATSLEMNDIGLATLELIRPMAVDTYASNRGTGAFIFIDPETNRTIAAGMITDAGVSKRQRLGEEFFGPIRPEEKVARWGHRGAILFLRGPKTLIDIAERSLFATGAVTVRVASAEEAETLTSAGFLVLLTTATRGDSLDAEVDGRQVTLSATDVISGIQDLLTTTGVTVRSEKASIR